MGEQVGCGKDRGCGMGKDEKAHQRLLDQAALARTEEGIRQGLEDSKEKEGAARTGVF